MYTDVSKTEHCIGCALIGDDIVVSRRILNFASNFTAELATLQDCIDMCHDTHYPTITFITDSHSAIQAQTQYNSANPLMQNIQHKIATFEKSVHLSWAPSHVGIRGNEEADNAAQNVILNFDVQEMKYQDQFINVTSRMSSKTDELLIISFMK